MSAAAPAARSEDEGTESRARPSGFGPLRRAGVDGGPPARPPALSQADLEALEKLGLDADPKVVGRITRIRPAAPEPADETVAPDETVIGRPKRAVHKSLSEVLEELGDQDVRLAPAPDATPARRPVFTGQPTVARVAPSLAETRSAPPAGPAEAMTAPARPTAPDRNRGAADPAPSTVPAPIPPATEPADPAGGEAEVPTSVLIGLLSTLSGNPTSESASTGPFSATAEKKSVRDEDGVAVISTWPPPGGVTAPSPLDIKTKGLGPVRSWHQLDIHRRQMLRRIRNLLMIVLVLGAGGAALWYTHSRSSGSQPVAWDSRVAPLAYFVHAETGQAWTHPVSVQFLTASEWESELSSASGPDPAGGGPARWDPARNTLFVDGYTLPTTVPDAYTDMVITGQLTVALQQQHPGATPATSAARQATKVEAAYLASLPARAKAALIKEERLGR